jgi:hypothetical protein
MGPEVLLAFVVLIVAVLGGGGLYAIRAGLWFKKADPDTPSAQAGKASQRPVHTVVENETGDRLTKPGDTAPPGADQRPA